MMGNIRRNACLIVALLAFASAAHAEETEVRIAPEYIPGVSRSEAEGLLALAEKALLLTIIDSRIAMDHRQGYLNGSLSLPDMETSCTSLATLIEAKDRPLLFYCNGEKCDYTRLYWYRGGFEDWKQKGFPV